MFGTSRYFSGLLISRSVAGRERIHLWWPPGLVANKRVAESLVDPVMKVVPVVRRRIRPLPVSRIKRIRDNMRREWHKDSARRLNVRRTRGGFIFRHASMFAAMSLHVFSMATSTSHFT